MFLKQLIRSFQKSIEDDVPRGANSPATSSVSSENRLSGTSAISDNGDASTAGETLVKEVCLFILLGELSC